ncbi:unnamed protein product [Cyprideis torosa]|uniref:small monomeric GTPase n=1 Tax=Cyprideis torosa TaxID=163714 RepID=A0A7R8W8S1_9CRUS|nr:unnamed protein product [Cyprideis torosa]CAG0883507.1 unnamed protein product [Cyprideis torosa]
MLCGMTSTLSNFFRNPGHRRAFRVAVIGVRGVGKSALTVRFLTRRYIGDYDPDLEKTYFFKTDIRGTPVPIEVMDTVLPPGGERPSPTLEANIHWADAFILMYSVTDKCSFDECYHLKFMIDYSRRRGKGLMRSHHCSMLAVPEINWNCDSVVLLVGNKNDAPNQERMVSYEEGLKRSMDMSCVGFHEISVRESVDQSHQVFHDLYLRWKANQCNQKREYPLNHLKRSVSFLSTRTDQSNGNKNHKEKDIVNNSRILWGKLAAVASSSHVNGTGRRRCTSTSQSPPFSIGSDSSIQEEDGSEETDSTPSTSPLGTEDVGFRSRASTEGHLQIIQRQWKLHSPCRRLMTHKQQPAPNGCQLPLSCCRRMSFSSGGKASDC